MKNTWVHWLRRPSFWIVAVMVPAVFVLYLPVLSGLADDWWNDPDYSHGLLVPLVSLYFVWERREKLKQLSVAPDYHGLWLLLGGIGLLTLGNAGSELFLMRISLIVSLAGLVVILSGIKILKALLFPVGFLFFMIPFPAIVFNAIAFPLQLFAAQTAAFCLQTIKIPVLREGNLIYLATSIMDVTEACSGIRSLMSLAALGTVFAYLTQKTVLKRALMMASTIPISIFSNAFRVAGTGILAQYVGEEAAQGFYHTFTGWLVFIVAFIMLLCVAVVFSKFPDRKLPEKEPVIEMAPQTPGRPLWVPLALSILILGSGIYVNDRILLHAQSVPLKEPLSALPLNLNEWSGEDHPFEEKTVKVLGVTDYVNRLYVAQDRVSAVWLYAGYYGSQRTGTTYHSPKNCLPGSGWEIMTLEELTVPMASMQGMTEQAINKVIVQKGFERQLILYWYQDRGRIITSEYWAKIYLIWDSITTGRTDGAMIRVSVPIPRGEGPEQALDLAIQYIHQVSPFLVEYLPGSNTVSFSRPVLDLGETVTPL